MLAYYGSSISGNMARTPEGFLICRNVPIARTGFQQYLPEEIGASGDAPLLVYRAPQEVFSAATLASFEGKPVTLGHPPADVSPLNAAAYACGHVQNVRRGAGADADLMLADLFLTDPVLIERVCAGVREISCGYDCVYAQGENGMEQRAIRGNHVAVVETGRAGGRVAIRDGRRPIFRERRKETMMARKKKLFGASLCDEAGEALQGQEQAAGDGALQRLLEAVERLTALLESRSQAESLDALEEELAAQEEQERAMQEAGMIAPQEQEEQTASLSAVEPVREAICALKPLIAALPEEKRTEAADRAARALRRARGMRDGRTGVYAAVSNARASAVRCEAEDALGKRIMAERNPHYKKRG
ncbi:MAG TPA: DUF2213 domain-containing protein [Candidatus Aphodomonas merdavium]|nr:DUF2213 domain-containing protein [Candidatus Aphodomonas merdavium]